MTKMTESSKLGHDKKARDQRQLCVHCGKLASLIELRFPVRKPSGAMGERRRKLFVHVECL